MNWVCNWSLSSGFRNKELKAVNIENTLEITNNIIITIKKRHTIFGLQQRQIYHKPKKVEAVEPLTCMGPCKMF